MTIAEATVWYLGVLMISYAVGFGAGLIHRATIQLADTSMSG